MASIPASNSNREPLSSQSDARPFLKWAGGKRQLLPELRRFYPPTFGRYFEPFVGSGAVFFDLYNRGLLATRKTILIDSNADLIGCYKVLRADPEKVIGILRKLARAYTRGGSTFYYEVRDKQFNPMRASLFAATADPTETYSAELAAMLIFLNRTGFNGLFRLNSKRAFNVPEGRYSNPQICDAENLHRVSLALNSNDVSLIHGQFDEVERLAAVDDFLYFDPPYAPLSKTARFTSYTAEQFGTREQQRLHDLLIKLARRGCKVLVSNSSAAEIETLYESEITRSARLRSHRVLAKRAINSKPSARGSVEEYILTNTDARTMASQPDHARAISSR